MDLLAGLNDAQRQAVVHDAGPLIVLAGPGTGKTRVIVHRVARRILSLEAEPSSVLAVTFTIKATEEMRKRIGETLHGVEPKRGWSLAAAVQVSTFHALGMTLLRRFSDVLGLPGRFEMIDDVQRHKLMLEIARRRGLFRSSIAAGLSSVVRHADRLMDRLADHAVTPADALTAAGNMLVAAREMPTEPTEPSESSESAAAGSITSASLVDVGGSSKKKAGKRGSKKAQAPISPRAAREAALLRAERFADAAALYDEYSTTCHARGWLTFRDLISLPIRLLGEQPRIASLMHDEVRHIVVDEFQDMNPAQIKLLTLLAGTSPRADVCVVGDDDQSIYAFRGADDRAFETFERAFPSRDIVRLEENYRSDPRIIAVSNSVIERAHHRFSSDKRVRPASRAVSEGMSATARSAGVDSATAGHAPNTRPSGLVQCIRLERDPHAGDVIAGLIRADMGLNPTRPISQYAVVSHAHVQLDRVATALELEGIPVRRVRRRVLADDSGVRVVIAWAELMLEPNHRGAARELLIRGPVNMPPAVVFAVEEQYVGLVNRSENEEDAAVHPGPYVDWLLGREELNDRARCALIELQSLAAAAPSIPADEMMQKIIRASEVADAELLDGRARAARVSALVSLLRYVRQRREKLEPPADLAAFWRDYAEDLQETHADEGALDASDLIDTESGDPANEAPAVSLLTVHAAKGLEFDVVFVPAVNPHARWPSGPRADEAAIEAPEGLLGPARTDEQQSSAALDEDRRLLYVAATRARHRLVVMSKVNKSRSAGANFFEELTLDEPASALVQTLDAADALGPDALPPASGLQKLVPAFDDAATRREMIQRLRQQTRQQAAAALDALDRRGLSEIQVFKACDALSAAGARIALLGEIGATSSVPGWLEAIAESRGDLKLRSDARAFLDRIGSATEPTLVSLDELFRGTSVNVGRLHAPLRLSYSKIKAYLDCPMCYFLRYVQGLDSPQGPEQKFGDVVHAALERFFKRWVEADAEGLDRPGPADLKALIRKGYFEKLGPAQPADAVRLEQFVAQGLLTLEKLHSPTDHVLELERMVRFEYTHGGQTHTFESRIDRVDALPGHAGAYRVIDYKTGYAKKTLREPPADDLQLGIYSLALDHLYPDDRDDSGHVPGLAEYWLLSIGQRGVLDLSTLKRDKVARAINEAIDGMLEGNWQPDKDCTGDCALLRGER